ncbi:bacteriohemerythrin, partial [Bacteroidota bacterium]
YKNWADLVQIAQRNSSIIENIYADAFQLRNNKEHYTIELENKLGLFHKSFLALKYGGITESFEDNNIKPFLNNKTTFLLDEIESQWIILEEIVYNMLAEPVFIKKINGSGNISSHVNPDYEEALESVYSLKTELTGYNNNLINEYKNFQSLKTKNFRIWQFILLAFSFAIVVFILYFIQKHVLKPIIRINQQLKSLQKGETDITIESQANDELGLIEASVANLSEKLKTTADYISAIGSGKLETEIELSGKRDALGKSLIKMQNNLKSATKENEKRRQEEEKQNWITAGLAKFSDILRNSDKGIKDLANDIILNLIRYINAIQGGLYMLVDDDFTGDKYLNLISSYAYDRKKFQSHQVDINEGLLGACYLEKETIFLTDIPENYINITSGLGHSNPKSIVIVPLKHENEVLGVVELASLNNFNKHEVEFIEQLSENIATTLSATTINERTAKLLQKAQEQAEELQSQEEEMRQNLEEMQATQEEAHKRSVELHDVVEAINNSTSTYELSIEGQFLKANNNYLKLLEIEDHELIGSSHFEYIKNNFEEQKAYTDFLKKLTKGITQKREFQYIIGEKEIWLNETYTPIHDVTESVSKILVLAHDITDTKLQELKIKNSFDEIMKKEEELQLKVEELDVTMMELEEKETQQVERIEQLNELIVEKDVEISNIIEAASEGIIKVDSNGFIVALNAIAASYAHKEKNDIVGDKIYDIFPPVFGNHKTKEKLKQRIQEFEDWTKFKIDDNLSIEIKSFVQGPENIINYYVILLREVKEKVEVEQDTDYIKSQKEWEAKEKELIQQIQELSREKRALKEEKVEHLTEDIEKDFIVWISKYNLQIPEMDDQHKRIVKLINEVNEALDGKKSGSEIVKIIKNLINYTSYHFHTEEDYFKEFKYKEAADHKKEHKGILTLLQTTEKNVAEGNLDKLDEDLIEIKSEIITHFTEVDIKYIDTFKMFGQ